MSAYIVSDKSFNALYTAFKSRKEKGDIMLALSETLRDSDVKELVNKWRNANYRAVNQRYGSTTRPSKWVPRILPEFENASDIQLFSIISNLTYQCAEGTVYKSTVYKQMEQFAHELAYKITMDHPDYSWGLK